MCRATSLSEPIKKQTLTCESLSAVDYKIISTSKSPQITEVKFVQTKLTSTKCVRV